MPKGVMSGGKMFDAVGFGAALRAACKAAGLTQTQLAKQLQLTMPLINRVCTGKAEGISLESYLRMKRFIEATNAAPPAVHLNGAADAAVV